jgi:hypothetical protein
MTTAMLTELPSENALRKAIERVRVLGYGGAMDAFTPYAIDGIDEMLGLRRPPVTAMLVPVFVTGGFFGYLVQRWCNAIAYAIDVGGRPNVAAPAFVIISFETAVLWTSFAAFFMLCYWCRIPKLHQPIFRVEGFQRASLDRFWLAMDTTHPSFDRDRLVRELEALGADRFAEVTQEGVL